LCRPSPGRLFFSERWSVRPSASDYGGFSRNLSGKTKENEHHDEHHPAADLAGTLPVLDLPPEELASVAAELQRMAVKLSLVEERLAQIGPGAVQC